MHRVSARVAIVAVVLVAVVGVSLAAQSIRVRPPGGAGGAQTSATPATVVIGTPGTPVVTGTAGTTGTTGTDAWDYCAAIGVIDRPDARYLGDGTRATIQDALALAERRPQRFADAAARRVAIPWRCMGGAVWACDPGANLPCGPANANRESTAGMIAYCAEHPDGVLPAYVTGHETIFAWSCRAGRAVIDRQPFQVDERGFVANFWYRLDRPR